MADSGTKISQLPALDISGNITLVGNGTVSGQSGTQTGTVDGNNIVSKFLTTSLSVSASYYSNLDAHLFYRVMGANTYSLYSREGKSCYNFDFFESLPNVLGKSLIARGTYSDDDEGILLSSVTGTVDGEWLVWDYLTNGGSTWEGYAQVIYKPYDWAKDYNSYYCASGYGYVKNTNPNWDAVSSNIYSQCIFNDLSDQSDSYFAQALDDRIIFLIFGHQHSYPHLYTYGGYMYDYFPMISTSAIPATVTYSTPLPVLLCAGYSSSINEKGNYYDIPYISRITLPDLVSYIRRELNL